MSRILGVDPGANGALALWDSEADTLDVWDMPTHTLTINGSKRQRIDEYELGRILREIADTVTLAVVEDVNSMPKQGVASTFSFGFASGGVRCAIAALMIPMELARPSVWKRGLRVSADKDSSRRRASQIFPKHCGLWSRKQDADRAEAALLAYFGKKFYRASVLD